MAATNTVIETITFPGFVAKMRQAREEAEKDGGYEAVAKILSLKGLQPYDPLGWGACAGGGAATICGCGGFST